MRAAAIDGESAVLDTRAWFPVICTLVGVVAGAFVHANAPRTYHASATILAVRESLPDSYARSDETDPDLRLHRLAQMTLLNYKLAPIVTRFGLYSGTSTVDDLGAETWKHLRLARKGSGSAPRYELRFEVSFDATNVRAAVAITEQLAALFLDQNPKPLPPADPADVALERELDASRQRLQAMEATLVKWRKNHSGVRIPARLDREYQRLQEEYVRHLRQREDRHPLPNIERRALGERFSIIEPSHLTRVDVPAAMPLLVRNAAAGAAYGCILWFVAFLWNQRAR